MWICFFLRVIGALVHEDGGSQRREQGVVGCGENFGETAQLYSGV